MRPGGGARESLPGGRKEDDFARRLRAQREAAERLAAQRAARLRGGLGVGASSRPPVTEEGRDGESAAPPAGIAEKDTVVSPSPATPPQDAASETSERPSVRPAPPEAAEPPARRRGERKRLPFTFADTEAPAPDAIGEEKESEPPAGSVMDRAPREPEIPPPPPVPPAPSVDAGGAGAAASTAPHAHHDVLGEAAAEPRSTGEAVAPYAEPAGAEELFEGGQVVPGRAGGPPSREDYVSALDDLVDEEPRRRSMGLLLFIIGLLIVVVVAVGAIFFYRTFGGGPGKEDVPVIVPEKKPVKTKPAPPQKPEPQQPTRRKKIYDRILKDDTEQTPGRLKPSEEKPLPPPPAPAPGDATPAEPLPLPLPPPPALDGGQGGMNDGAPAGGEKRDVRVTDAGDRPLVTGGDHDARIAAGQETATIDAGKVDARPAGAGEEATGLPALPPPPPLPEPPGAQTAGAKPAAMDADGMARLAAQAAGDDAQSAPDSMAAAGPAATTAQKAKKVQPTAGAQPAAKIASETESRATRQAAARMQPQPARERTPRVERQRPPRRKAARTERRERAALPRRVTERRAPRQARTAAGRTGGPRSILPPALGARPARPVAGDRLAAYAPAQPATAVRGPKPIVPPPALQAARQPRKVTNFNAGARTTPATAPRKVTNLAPARKAANTTPARPAMRTAPAVPQRQRVAALPPRTAPAPAPATPSRQAPQAGQGGGGYLVQLAAYRSREDALRAYQRLQARHGALLGGMSPRIERKDLGTMGTFYRLAVGPLPSRTAARKLCNALIARGEKDCLVRRR